MSLMMQRFTAYVIEINDFGKVCEVSHRYSDFEALYKALLLDLPGLQLPPMPPKGADGTDAAVIGSRKVELEKVLRAMIANAEVVMEKSLHLWKFLELGNPTVIATRFVTVPRARGSVFKTLAKLNDEKYRDDVYRLGHASVTDLLLEGLREHRRGTDSGHWSCQKEGRMPLCQLVAGALGTTQAARDRLVDGGVIGLLLGLVQVQDTALDDVRPALNVIVAREGERLASLVARFLTGGGLLQLLDLVQRPRCQEFVAKLLWLAWDASTRSAFAQPGGVGLKVLQSLLRSATPTCSLLGAVLLAGMVAAGDFHDASHRTEAFQLVRATLERPEAAKDPAFVKALVGGNSAFLRLAAMLEDPDLAPLILGLLCVAKPPAAKMGQISGNLASLVSNKGGVHSEQTKARAAELLLQIQGSSTTSEASGGEVSSTVSTRASINDLLERCEGIAAHEESLENALRAQLEEGIAKGLKDLAPHGQSVREVGQLSQVRLKELPGLDFKAFDHAFDSFRAAREALAANAQKCESLHQTISRQLSDLQSARPNVDPHVFKEKLLTAERLYSEVKSQRDAFATADAEAKEKTSRSQASTAKMKTLTDALRRYDQELQELRSERKDKETKAAMLRSQANTPGLADRKRQVQEDIDRNLEEARELQVIGRRVQQGEDGYIPEGQSRESKISELTAKLNELKRHHQTLLQKQKELDIDPVDLGNRAEKLETEARDLDSRVIALEDKQRQAERERIEASGDATREAEDARIARDHSSNLSSRLASVERDAKAQLSALQPMIQEQHAGWQRLLEKQRNLDEDQHNLAMKLLEAKTSADSEARAREHVAGVVQALIQSLLGFSTFLDSCGEAVPTAVPTAVPAPAVEEVAAPAVAASVQEAAAPSTAAAPFQDDFDEFLNDLPSLAKSEEQRKAARLIRCDRFISRRSS